MAHQNVTDAEIAALRDQCRDAAVAARECLTSLDAGSPRYVVVKRSELWLWAAHQKLKRHLNAPDLFDKRKQ